MNKAQKGGTMIETLCVLALAGLISLVGLAAFLMAMNRHYANQILDYVNRCAVVALAHYDGYIVEDTFCGNLLSDKAPHNLDGMQFVVSGATGNQTKYTVTTPYIKSDALRAILVSRMTTTNNGEVIDIWDFQGKIEFTFRKN